MKKRNIALAFMSILWLLSMASTSWAGPLFLGESTWTMSITMDEDGATDGSSVGSVAMAITRLGGTYYSAQGYLTFDDDGPFVMAGGGVLIEDTLYLNMTTTQKHSDEPNRDTGILQIQLDKTTLNGTFYTVGYDFNLNDAGPNPVWDSRFAEGTVTLTGTALNLSATSSSLAGPMSLLLE